MSKELDEQQRRSDAMTASQRGMYKSMTAPEKPDEDEGQTRCAVDVRRDQREWIGSP